MASLCKVILIGNLCSNPTTRYLSNGDAVTNVTIATSETWKDKNNQKQEKAEFHRVTFYRKLAEIAGEYLKKGKSVYVEGRLETRKYTAPYFTPTISRNPFLFFSTTFTCPRRSSV